MIQPDYIFETSWEVCNKVGGIYAVLSTRAASMQAEHPDKVIFYCVGNMPGAVPRTSTVALTNTTIKFAAMIADMGLENACRKNEGLANGVNLYCGKCTNFNVAQSLSLDYTPLADIL